MLPHRPVRSTAVPMVTLAVLLSTSCEHYEVMAIAVSHVQVEPGAQLMARGETRPFTAKAVDEEGRELTGRDVVWTTLDATIAQVDENGMVSGVGIGTTDVIALIEGQEGRAAVTVTPPKVRTVDVAPGAVSLRPGDAATLKAQLTATDGTMLTDRAVTWGSSNRGVADVDDAGNVSAVGVGAATITASAEGVDGTASVTVALEPVAKVTVSPANRSLDVNEFVNLTVQLEGAGGTDLTGAGRTVDWTSSSADVVLTPATGVTTKATALAATCAVGQVQCTVTITATSEGVSGTATIVVNKAGASVIVTPQSATLDVGQSVDLTAQVLAGDGTDVTAIASIAWASGADIVLNPASGSGVTATAAAATCAAGQSVCPVDVTATVDGVSDAATITVRKPRARIVVTPSAHTLDVGVSVGLTAAVVAQDGTDLTAGTPINWSAGSADVSVAATGPASATATAQSASCPPPARSCDVTVTASSPGLPSGTATITVRKAVASVTIQPASPLSLTAGTGQALAVTVAAADGSPITDMAVSWSVADAQIAAVTPNASGLSAALATPALPVCTGDPCTTSVVATVQGTGITDTLVVNVAKTAASITIMLSGTRLSATGLLGPKSLTATAEVFAADGTKLARTVTWAAQAGSTLVVTPTAADTATVTTTSLVGGQSGWVSATVGAVTTQSVTINVTA